MPTALHSSNHWITIFSAYIRFARADGQRRKPCCPVAGTSKIAAFYKDLVCSMRKSPAMPRSPRVRMVRWPKTPVELECCIGAEGVLVVVVVIQT